MGLPCLASPTVDLGTRPAGHNEKTALPPAGLDFEGCHGSPDPVRIERWRTSLQGVPVIWYILSVNLHGLCTQHTVCSGTWDEAFAQLLSPFLAGLCFRSWASKAKLVFEGEGGKLGRQK